MVTSTITGPSRAQRRVTELGLRLTEVGLRVSGVLAALTALAFLLGTNGLGLLHDGTVPRTLGTLTGTRDAYAQVLSERAEVVGREGLATVAAINERVGPLGQGDNGTVAPDEVEASGPTEVAISFWGLHTGQRWAWTLSRVIGPATGATVLWLLAGVVAAARHGDPFTCPVARRLRWVTGLVLVGGTASDWSQELVRLWLLNGSEARDLVPFGLSLSVRWIGAGLLLAAVVLVWQRGVAMREDLEGLV